MSFNSIFVTGTNSHHQKKKRPCGERKCPPAANGNRDPQQSSAEMRDLNRRTSPFNSSPEEEEAESVGVR